MPKNWRRRNKKFSKQTSKHGIYDTLNLRFGLFRRWLYIILWRWEKKVDDGTKQSTSLVPIKETASDKSKDKGAQPFTLSMANATLPTERMSVNFYLIFWAKRWQGRGLIQNFAKRLIMIHVEH